VTNFALVFATGLTAGGLSCLAVQGGMLASSLAGQAETRAREEAKVGSARPIILFLGAKLIAYTILGFALGWLGQILQLTPLMRAALQIAIGLFMLGTALRLLGVRALRNFVIEPPKAVTRAIRRRTSQADAGWLAPTFLGALTVLIPCGVTQAMMALAVASGSPVAGALILFAFVLGTTPLFFTLAYLATKLGAKWQGKFWKATGVVVLILSLIAIDSGLVLAGSPLSFTSSLTSMRQAMARSIDAARERQAGPQQALPAVVASADNELTMTITDQAYAPAVMEAKAGMPIKLTVKTDNVRSCARSLVVPSMNLQKLLGATDSQVIVLPPTVAGTIRLACVMGMYSAQINVK